MKYSYLLIDSIPLLDLLASRFAGLPIYHLNFGKMKCALNLILLLAFAAPTVVHSQCVTCPGGIENPGADASGFGLYTCEEVDSLYVRIIKLFQSSLLTSWHSLVYSRMKVLPVSPLNFKLPQSVAHP